MESNDRDERVEEIKGAMRSADYLCDDAIATALFLADELGKPILAEGPAGVGKTDLAKAYATSTGMPLIRLQCYEGLDEAKALYEWNYKKQLLRIQADTAGECSWEDLEGDLFSEDFLLPRPLLKAITNDQRVVLLVDEVDKSDVEFEAFLLEVLSDFQVSIPELGTVEARRHPFVVLTSNRTRDLSEALRRRCLYLYIDFPEASRELEIIRLRVPGLAEGLAEKVLAVVRYIRQMDLKKAPSISETLDWATAVSVLGRDVIDQRLMSETLSLLVKEQKDLEKVAANLPAVARQALL
ncbi:MAG: MoxR family ATPase [Actinobacteria bacterium]|nr:MoxR family ATPase [Actinomycetota bacterium]MBU1943114.1 MoxR family ATPase [Actinomycetota bacterium]MBU2687939.1 MoxR family ATPase [Actinomycetota bacterium]